MNIYNSSKIGSNFIFSIMITIIIGCVNFLYPIIIGIIYYPEILGKFTVLFYWTTILSIPIANGITPSITRFLAATTNNKQLELEGFGTKILIYYFCIILIVFPIIGKLVLGFDYLEIIIIILLILFSSIHFIFRGSYQGLEEFKKLFRIELISFLLFCVSSFIFCILPHLINIQKLVNHKYFLLPLLIFHFSFIIIILIKKFKHIKLNNFFTLPKSTKNILFYALMVGMGSLFSLGISQVQILLSDYYLSLEELGILSFWNSLINPILLLSIALSAILLPRITNLIKIKKDISTKFVNIINWLFTLILIPLFGLILIIVDLYPQFLDLLTLKKYSAVTYKYVIIFLAANIICNFLNVVSIAFFSSTEKTVKINPIVSFIYSMTIILSWLFLVPRYGIFGFTGGLAIGGIVSYFLTQFILFLITKRKIGSYQFFSFFLLILIGGSILLIHFYRNPLFIIPLSVITIPLLIIGFIQLKNTIKDDTYKIKLAYDIISSDH